MTRNEALTKAENLLKLAESDLNYKPDRAEACAEIARQYIELAKELRLGS